MQNVVPALDTTFSSNIDAAEVVENGTEPQRHLPHVGPLRDPRRADVIDVVEHEARDRLLPQIEVRARLARS